MKILAIAKVDPQTTPQKIEPYLEEEVKYAWKLYEEGTIREMYNGLDRRLGVVFILECSSLDEAREKLAEFPFVREKLIAFEMIPLGPFSHYSLLFQRK